MNTMLDKTLGLTRGFKGVSLTPLPHMCSSPDGYIHFSIPTIVGEEAAWWPLGREHAVPASINIQLLRAAHIARGLITAQADVVRNGKSVMVSQSRVTQDGELLALVTVTFVHFEKRQPPSVARVLPAVDRPNLQLPTEVSANHFDLLTIGRDEPCPKIHLVDIGGLTHEAAFARLRYRGLISALPCHSVGRNFRNRMIAFPGLIISDLKDITNRQIFACFGRFPKLRAIPAFWPEGWHFAGVRHD